MEIGRDVFKAIADPTRRAIIEMIAKKSLNVNSVAEHFDMSRQAVSLHVKVLADCGLILIKQEGRERYCEAKLDSLSEVSEWVERYKKFWEKRLDSMENYLYKLKRERRHAKNKR